MYPADYHTHSLCSPDSTTPLEDMAIAARRAGMAELCTTDHCDLLQEDGSVLKDWDWTPILRQYERARKVCPWPDFKLLLGIELGGAHTDPQRAADILAGAPLDFVIGSIHNLSPAAGGRDFYFLEYTSREQCSRYLDDYMAGLQALAALPTYDALGHIIYPLRYMNGRGGHRMTLDPWQEQLDEVLRTVIQTGRAIEVNTHGGREIKDWIPIVRRYKELGGEFITLGSDAHRTPHVGRGIRPAMDLLRDNGFRWVTCYRQRQPEQNKLV